MKKLLKRLAQRSVLAQRAYRWYRRHTQTRGYPDWTCILGREAEAWERARRTAAGGQKVLLATSMGGLPTGIMLDSFLGVALTMRGANVHFLLCDSFLPACLMTEIGLLQPKEMAKHGPQKHICETCAPIGFRLLRQLGLPVHRLSENVTSEERAQAARLAATIPLAEIGSFEQDGVSIGEHAMAGALRYFARSSLDGAPYGEVILRRYFEASLLSADATRRLMRMHRFEAVSCVNGIYAPQGPIVAVARAEGARVATWNVAYRKRCFVFSHGDTYHHTLMSERVSEWENIPWSADKERDTMGYLNSRRRGGRDWIVFQARSPNEDLVAISRALGGVDFSKPCIGMLTNVAWDAQLHYPANAFPNMIDWVLRTIEYLARRPDLQLIIRIHPAEVSGDIPSRQPVTEEIARRFPTLPPNVFVIRPESSISTYAVMEACNAVLIYGTKTGVELTSLGIPVIVAGEAWIRNKNITQDAKSAAHYFELLDRLPLSGRMDESSIQRARKYAYHFFFRRMIPISQMEPTGGEPQVRVAVTSVKDLLPGRGAGLDVICDGILRGTPFVYPAERLEAHPD